MRCEPHFASTKGLNDWLSDAVEAKQLLEANWGRKLHWLKHCFHKDQEKHEQLKPFREQLRRRSLLSHRFYHLFHKWDEGFSQPKLYPSSGVAFGECKRIFRLSAQFSRRSLVIAQDSIGKIFSVVISEHLSMVELKCNGRIFCQDIFSGFFTMWF